MRRATESDKQRALAQARQEAEDLMVAELEAARRAAADEGEARLNARRKAFVEERAAESARAQEATAVAMATTPRRTPTPRLQPPGDSSAAVRLAPSQRAVDWAAARPHVSITHATIMCRNSRPITHAACSSRPITAAIAPDVSATTLPTA